MKNAQLKINKIITALKFKGKIILMNQEQFYSRKYEKICSKFIIRESTPRKMELVSKIKELEKIDKKNKNDKNLEKINELKKELSENFLVGKLEFFNKLDVLLFLVDYYKKVGGTHG